MSGAGARIAVVVAAAAAVGGAIPAACGEEEGPLRNASAERGRALIEQKGCGTCHTIGGIPNANGKVGPSLKNFENNRVIAGQIPNAPPNVVRWIVEPRSVAPSTLMPDLDLTPEQARAVADYLYTQ